MEIDIKEELKKTEDKIKKLNYSINDYQDRLNQLYQEKEKMLGQQRYLKEKLNDEE